jgi:hypothetical protein
MGRSSHLTPVGIRWKMSALTMFFTMKNKKPTRLVGARKSVFANITNEVHARVQRRAPAAHLSSAKYTAVALEFYMDLEEAFNGPMTEQVRASILRTAQRQGDIVKKALQ